MMINGKQRLPYVSHFLYVFYLNASFKKLLCASRSGLDLLFFSADPHISSAPGLHWRTAAPRPDSPRKKLLGASRSGLNLLFFSAKLHV